VAVNANGNLSINGHAPGALSEHDGHLPAKELTLRAAKKPEKRSERGSGTMTLVELSLEIPMRMQKD
jgi:hypothetical protein